MKNIDFVAQTFAVRHEVFCEYCGQRVHNDVPESAPNRAVADHRLPKARGGTNQRENLALVCAWCNTEKGVLSEAEFRPLIRSHGQRRELATLTRVGVRLLAVAA